MVTIKNVFSELIGVQWRKEMYLLKVIPIYVPLILQEFNMIFTNLRKKTALLLGAGIVSFIMIGCSSGSDSSDSSDAKEYTEISENNADQVIATVLLTSTLDDSIPDIGLSNENLAISTEKLTSNLITSLDARAKIAVAESGTEECPDGGFVSYEIDSTTGTFIFDQCAYDGLIMNGKIIITTHYPAATVEMIELTVDYIDEADLYLEYAKIEIDDVDDINSDFSIIMTGVFTDGGDTVEVEKYSWKKSGDTYRYDGLIRADCLGAWVEIETTIPLIISNDSCPVGGKIIVSGTNNS